MDSFLFHIIKIILVGYKDKIIYSIYDLPYMKTKRGYFLLIVNEKIDELLLPCDKIDIRINEMRRIINETNILLYNSNNSSSGNDIAFIY